MAFKYVDRAHGYVANEESDELAQILAFAEEGNYRGFVDSLILCTHGRPIMRHVQTMFIFPETLSKELRQKVHRMQTKKMLSNTNYGKLHVFLIDLDLM